MKILDFGHKYKLGTLDGDVDVVLTFVKRNDPSYKYPGNVDAYPGTTLQEVLRASLQRMHYVNWQADAQENHDIIRNLRKAILLLEQRAARVHGRDVNEITMDMAEFGPFCTVCGHVGHQCPVEAEEAA